MLEEVDGDTEGAVESSVGLIEVKDGFETHPVAFEEVMVGVEVLHACQFVAQKGGWEPCQS